MQAQGIYAMEDITDRIPNLMLTTTGRHGIQALFVRGIGNSSTNNLEPGGAVNITTVKPGPEVLKRAR